MLGRKNYIVFLILLISGIIQSCTDELKEYQDDPSLRAGKLTIRGDFCADKSQEMNFPVHILFVTDQSYETRDRDPDFCRDTLGAPPCAPGQRTNLRQEAIREVWLRYIINPYYDFGIIEYSDTINATSLQNDQNIFVGGYAFEQYAASIIEPPVEADPDLTRDMYHGLEFAKFYINHHLSQTSPEDRVKQRYIIINFTAGMADNTTGGADISDDISDMVDELMGLKDMWGAGDITVNSAFLTRDTIPAGEVTETTNLMNAVAYAGNGESIIFDPDSDPLDVPYFMDYDLYTHVQVLTIKSFVASNFSVKVNESGSLVTDSDGDGLPDAEDNRVISHSSSFLQNSDTGGCVDFAELILGTDTTVPEDDCSPYFIPGTDSDGDTCPDVLEIALYLNTTDPTDCHITQFMDSDSDGCSDFVEFIVSQSSAHPLDPYNSLDCSPSLLQDSDLDGCRDWVEVSVGLDSLDPFDCDCPEDKRIDSENDGLLDCEEELIGIDKRLFDDDKDGLPDIIEFHGGSNPHSLEEGFNDVDNDGITNNEEVREHTNPEGTDSSERDQIAYQYELTNEGLNDEGVYCYTFAVKNISLLNTQAVGEGSEGLNRIVLEFIETPQDATFITNQGIMRTKEFNVRYGSSNELFLVADDGSETLIENDIVLEDADIKSFEIVD